MKDIKIISATRHMCNAYDKTLIFKSIDKLECEYKIECDNTKSLASVYNTHIIDKNKDKILVFSHDDSLIEDLFLQEKLNESIKEFDIVGVAGIKPNITLKAPALWHLMGDRSQLTGAVAHFTGKDDKERFVTNFGTTPERTILLDGVLLAINTENILKSGLKFDETNPAKFHFYDLDFCLSANRLGLKCGTYPIFLTHRSHGLITPSQEFLDGQNWFLDKWRKIVKI
jgi:GT2 family glycosyltransferase